MRKKILLIILFLFLLFLGGLGFIYLKANDIVASLKPEIIRIVNSRLGLNLSVDTINIAFFPETKLQLKGLGVKGDQNNKDGIKIKEIELNTSFKELISGKIQVKSLSIIEPSLVVLKTSEGIEIVGLPKKRPNKEPENKPTGTNETKASQTNDSHLSLNIEKLEVRDGIIEYRDPEESKSFFAKELSLKTAIEAANDLFIMPAPEIEFSADSIGTFKLQVSKAQFSPSNRNISIGSYTLSSVKTSLNQAPFTLTTTGNLQSELATLSALDISGFAGKISMPLTLAIKDKSAKGKLTISGIHVDQLLKAAKPDLKNFISGIITSLGANFSASLAPDIVAGIDSSGSLKLSDGALKGFNLAGALLKKVDNIPLISNSLAYYVPAEFQPLINSPDTTIKTLTTDFSIKNGVVSFSNTQLQSDIFSLETSGNYSIKTKSVDATATITFTKEFSLALTHSIKELDSILSADKNLVIPLKLKGVPPDLSVQPNIDKLLKVAGKRVIRDQASDLIGRALGDKLGGKAGNDAAAKAIENLLGF